MEIANCWLTLDKQGSNTPLFGITPPELVYFVKNRKDLLGRFPITDLKITRKVNLPDDVLRKRLQFIFGPSKTKGSDGKSIPNIDILYPPHTAKFPQTFEETGLFKEASAVKVASEHVTETPDESSVPATLQSEDYWKEQDKEKTAVSTATK